jgi:hypothetical protein
MVKVMIRKKATEGALYSAVTLDEHSSGNPSEKTMPSFSALALLIEHHSALA